MRITIEKVGIGAGLGASHEISVSPSMTLADLRTQIANIEEFRFGSAEIIGLILCGPEGVDNASVPITPRCIEQATRNGPSKFATLQSVGVREKSLIRCAVKLGGSPLGPFPGQWIKSICVNGVPLFANGPFFPHTQSVADIPTEVAPGFGTVITVTFCSWDETYSSDNGDQGAVDGHSVNVQALASSGFFELAKGESEYYGSGDYVMRVPRESQLQPRLQSSMTAHNRLVLTTPTSLQAGGIAYTLYTSSLGPGSSGSPGELQDEYVDAAVRYYGCFRNPESWTFRTLGGEAVVNSKRPASSAGRGADRSRSRDRAPGSGRHVV